MAFLKLSINLGLFLRQLICIVLFTGIRCQDKLSGGPALLIADHHDFESRLTFLKGTGAQIYDRLEKQGSITYYVLKHDYAESEKKAMTFDYHDRLLFWSDPGQRAIFSLNLATGTHLTVYSGTSSTVEGVSVDWAANNIYWTDAEYNWIKISNYDGSHSRTLFTTDINHPTGIACNPSTGYLYWSDTGEKFRIERSTLSGANRTVLVDEDVVGADVIGEPTSLTMDYASNVLYWSDSLNGRIVGLDLNNDSSIPYTVLHDPSTFGRLFGIEYDASFGFFVTDRENKHVHIVPRNTRKVIFSIVTQYHEPNGLVYYQRDRQPNLTDPCKNTACNQLCVSHVEGYKCLCSQEYKLTPNSTQCVIDDRIISDHELIVSLVGGNLCQLPANLGHVPDISTMVCFDDVAVDSLDFEVRGHMMFASHLNASDDGKIWKTLLESETDWKDVVLLPEGNIKGLAVDWLASNLYWTDGYSRSIGISRLNGLYRRQLITEGVDTPSAIAVHAKKMYLFWTDIGSDVRIERSTLQGRQRQVLVGSGLQQPTHLAIDFATDRLFWSDDGTQKIESISFTGEDRKVFKTIDEVPFVGITAFQDFLYVAQKEPKHIVVYSLTKQTKVRTLSVKKEMTAIKFFHKSLQPLSSGPCDIENGGCDHVCINTKDGPECVCSDYQIGVCTPEIRCPLNIPFGKMSDTCDNRNENSCHYLCFDEYVRITEQAVTCSESGEWSIPSDELCVHAACSSRPCKNGGACVGSEWGYNCSCLPDWTGDNCEINTIPKQESGSNSALVILGVLVGVFATATIMMVIGIILMMRRGKYGSGGDTQPIIPQEVRFDKNEQAVDQTGFVNDLYFNATVHETQGPAATATRQYSVDVGKNAGTTGNHENGNSSIVAELKPESTA
ncbi:low-density lipoprotein receptor-related protein 6-like [Ptychodera flava]|uniref:low-density lipoprotein receptor-related protein 6-like n=1 Tax=Ptychodera flava TaxID=63121 RepID=UPI00396A4EC4